MSIKLKSLFFDLVKIYAPTFLLIVLVWLLGETTSISVYELVADPSEVGNIPPYTGFVSLIGTLLFCSGVAICLFSAYLVKNSKKVSQKWGLFFQVSGYFLLVLLLDDLFQLHENFSTLLFGIEANVMEVNRQLQNLLEMTVFIAYGIFTVIYWFYFRKLIYRTELIVLLLAFVFFGASVVVDIFLETIKGHFVIEEGFKLLGIVTLVTYYIRVCLQIIKKMFLVEEMYR